MLFNYSCLTVIGGLLMFGSAQAEVRLPIDASDGKACWVAAYTNSAAVWTLTILTGTATAVKMSGSGINFAPMKVIEGNARFTVKSGLEAIFDSSTGRTEVKLKASTIVNKKGDPAVFGNLFGGEDGTDDDWQDILVNVTCLHHSG